MTSRADLDSLPISELRALGVELIERIGELSRIVLEQREEIARLKGLGRPDIKPPSGPSGNGEGRPSSWIGAGQATWWRPEDGTADY